MFHLTILKEGNRWGLWGFFMPCLVEKAGQGFGEKQGVKMGIKRLCPFPLLPLKSKARK